MRPLARLTAAAIGVVLMLVCASSAAAASPANDLFATAELLTGSSATASTPNVEATKETAEPNHRGYGGGHSVWYRWVAPADGTVTVSGGGSTFASVLAVYSGLTVDGLTPVGSGLTLYSVRFSAEAGHIYHIAVDSPWGDVGTVNLSLTHVDPPPNDAFATPHPLTGTSDVATGHTIGATREPGEPVPAGYGAGSIWFEWTAPKSGGVTLSTEGSSYNTVLGVYTGSDVAALTRVASNDDANYTTKASQVKFSAVAGTTYRFLVDGYYVEDVGNVEIALTLTDPPANDAFAAAIALPSEAAAIASGTNDAAGVEPGEPTHDASWYYGARHSVWYSWTAPKDGSLTVKTTATFQTVLAVYTGDSVSQLGRVVNQPQDWNGGPEQIRVRVEAGVTYRIAVDSALYYYNAASVTGEFSLSLSLIDSPSNDDFEDADPLIGLSADVEGSTVGATQEPCEPVHDDNYYDPSVWYEWTAPASGGVTLDTAGSEFNTVLGVYTGDSLCELARVPLTRTSLAGVPAKRRFRAAAGVTYRIAVDGARAAWGKFNLSLRFSPAPVNDMFLTALPLIGESAEVKGDNVGATGEGGEPNPGGTAGASVWYSWIAPKDGLAVIRLGSADFEAGVAAYTGDSVDALTPVGTNYYGPLTFNAKAGAIYRIAVHGGWLPSRGEFALGLAMVDPPPNDDFADAVELDGSVASVGGTTAAATAEPEEPTHGYAYDNYTGSVWYRWTAKSDGTVTMSQTSHELYQVTAVYKGDSLGTLTQVASGYSSYGGTFEFEAEAGTTYSIVVAGPPGRADGRFALTLEHGSPPNDAFADAEELSGASDSTTGSNRNASEEPGEPSHYGYGRRSIWYRWTAPKDGTTVVDLAGTYFDSVHAVYTGSSVDALTLVAGQDGQQLTFTAQAGVTYHIAVDGWSDYATGPVQLALAMHEPPANDDFADAAVVDGGAFTISGSTLLSTREAYEPDHWYGGWNSVWYRWTAPESARTSVWVPWTATDANFAIYTGTSLDSLTRTTGNAPAGVAWVATAGETYWIAVTGYSPGAFTLQLEQDPPAEAGGGDPPLDTEPDPPLDTEPELPLDKEPEQPLDGQQEQSVQQDQPSQQQAPPGPGPGTPDAKPPANEPQPWVAPPAPSLSLMADFPAQRLGSVLEKGLAGTAACSTACNIDALVTLDPVAAKKAGLRGAKLTTAAVTVYAKAGVIKRLTVRLPKATRAKLKRAKSVKLTVKLTARWAGQTDSVTKRLTLKR